MTCLNHWPCCPCPHERHADATIVYGLCLHCQSIEVALNAQTGTRDLSSIGESDTYPTGYGCEVCD